MMRRMTLIASAVLCCLALRAEDTAALDADVKGGWARVMREYYWEPTSLIYTCLPKDVQKADFYTDGFRVWERSGDYGHGLEDCAIICGVALSGLCDRYLVTGERSLADDARKLARGLVNLATVHGRNDHHGKDNAGFAGCVPGGGVCVARVEEGGVRRFSGRRRRG